MLESLSNLEKLYLINQLGQMIRDESSGMLGVLVRNPKLLETILTLQDEVKAVLEKPKLLIQEGRDPFIRIEANYEEQSQRQEQPTIGQEQSLPTEFQIDPKTLATLTYRQIMEIENRVKAGLPPFPINTLQEPQMVVRQEHPRPSLAQVASNKPTQIPVSAQNLSYQQAYPPQPTAMYPMGGYMIAPGMSMGYPQVPQNQHTMSGGFIQPSPQANPYAGMYMQTSMQAIGQAALANAHQPTSSMGSLSSGHVHMPAILKQRDERSSLSSGEHSLGKRNPASFTSEVMNSGGQPSSKPNPASPPHQSSFQMPPSPFMIPAAARKPTTPEPQPKEPQVPPSSDNPF
jgi:hypothetical protein